VVGSRSNKAAGRDTDPRARVRRKDREIVAQEKIAALLEHGSLGFIATALDDQPYLNPNLYWYDSSSQSIYFHTAIQGRTRANIEKNPKVCFCIAEMGRLLPADTAMEFSNEYASVIVFGRCKLLQSEEQQRYALQGLLDKYFPDLKPDVDYRGITHEELSHTSVFEIAIESWSGKEKSTKE
jgi:nitroimidazol reductase NimA-like FMN-containing flavoprotein (pyridoxamine 5'-phosphate oxidase superfamily)